MKHTFKEWGLKFLRWLLDVLMFVVPIMELTEVIAIISTDNLPYYMLATVILRRVLRMIEEYLDDKTSSVD
jgi:hypothetical protein